MTTSQAPGAGTGQRLPHVVAWLKVFAPDGLVLEAAPGGGQYSSHFDAAAYRSFDVPETWYDFVRLPDVFASADRIPFRAGVFALAFCVSAFDYFPDPVEVLREFRRCLTPGGSLLVFTYDRPTLELIDERCRELPPSRARMSHHVFDAEQLGRWAATAGLAIEELPLEPRPTVVARAKRMLRPSNFRNYHLSKR